MKGIGWCGGCMLALVVASLTGPASGIEPIESANAGGDYDRTFSRNDPSAYQKPREGRYQESNQAPYQEPYQGKPTGKKARKGKPGKEDQGKWGKPDEQSDQRRQSHEEWDGVGSRPAPGGDQLPSAENGEDDSRLDSPSRDYSSYMRFADGGGNSGSPPGPEHRPNSSSGHYYPYPYPHPNPNPYPTPWPDQGPRQQPHQWGKLKYGSREAQVGRLDSPSRDYSSYMRFADEGGNSGPPPGPEHRPNSSSGHYYPYLHPNPNPYPTPWPDQGPRQQPHQWGKLKYGSRDAEASDPAVGALRELRDPAFDRFVDLMLLAAAWDELDSELLADIGLELVEGERVLRRSHKAISADEVLQAAIRVAAEKQDNETLARLKDGLQSLGKIELVKQIESAQKLGASSRSDANTIAKLEQSGPEGVEVFRSLMDRLQSARIHGDRRALEAMHKDLEKMEQLSDDQRQYLQKITGESRDAVAEQGEADTATEALQRLSDMSRQWYYPRPGTWSYRLSLYYEAVPSGVGYTYRVTGVPNGGGQLRRTYLESNDVIVAFGGNGSHSTGWRSSQSDLDEVIGWCLMTGQPYIHVKNSRPPHYIMPLEIQ